MPGGRSVPRRLLKLLKASKMSVTCQISSVSDVARVSWETCRNSQKLPGRTAAFAFRRFRHLSNFSATPPPRTAALSARVVDAVLFRTSGILTNALSPCHQSYLALLWQALGDVAQLHVLTDLSLSLAPDLAAAELRRLSDAHQQKLSEQLNGIPSFAYTVADIVAAFPSVAWPVPGELYPTTMLNNDTRLWLRASWDRLEARGMRLTRRLETGKVVSNLLSYYVHEPSLCVWLRRQQLTSGNDIPRRACHLALSVPVACLLRGASCAASVPLPFQPMPSAGASGWWRRTWSSLVTCDVPSYPLPTAQLTWSRSSSRPPTLTTSGGCMSTPLSGRRCLDGRCTSGSTWSGTRSPYCSNSRTCSNGELPRTASCSPPPCARA